MARHKEFDPDVVLDRAIDVFRHRGFEAASTAVLFAEMGIGRGSLYEAFGTKDQLFRAALKRYQDRSLGGMIAALEPAKEPLATIRGLFEAIARNHAAGDIHGCLSVHCTVELGARAPEIAELLRDSWDRLALALARALTRAKDSGNLDNEEHPRALARFLITILRGMGVTTKLRVSRTGVSDIVRIAMWALETHPAVQLWDVQFVKKGNVVTILHHKPIRPFSQRVEILLELKGVRDQVAFEVVDMTKPRSSVFVLCVRAPLA